MTGIALEPAGEPTADSELEREGAADRDGTVRRNLGALAGGQLATWTMTLLWALVVPRVLGPAQLGLVVSATAISGVMGIVLALGARAYLVREIVVDRERAPELVGTAIVMRILPAPVVGLAAYAFARWAHYDRDASVVLYLATAMTIFGLLAEPMQAAFQAIERMKYLAYTDVINKSAQSLVGIALALIGLRAVGIMAEMTVAAAVVIMLNLVWLRPFLKVRLRTSVRLISTVFTGSLPYWATGTFSMIYLWIDTAMLSLLTRPMVVGWYGVTTTLFQTLLFVPVIASTVWLPRMVSAFEISREELMRVAKVPLELVMVSGFPIGALLTIFAPLIVRLLYGTAYGHAVPVLIGLAACLPWMYLNIVFSSVLVAMKRPGVWTFVMVGAAIVNPLFNVVLIQAAKMHFHNGAIGASASMVLTELLMDMVGMALIGRAVVRVESLRRWALAALASGAAVAADFVTQGLGEAVSIAVGVAVLVALAFPLRLVTAHDLNMGWSAIQRLRGRRASRRAGAVASANE